MTKGEPYSFVVLTLLSTPTNEFPFYIQKAMPNCRYKICKFGQYNLSMLPSWSRKVRVIVLQDLGHCLLNVTKLSALIYLFCWQSLEQITLYLCTHLLKFKYLFLPTKKLPGQQFLLHFVELALPQAFLKQMNSISPPPHLQKGDQQPQPEM